MNIIKPMEPILTKQIPESNEWIHQIKWDGIRGLTYINQDRVEVYTKKGNNHTNKYPELQELKKLLNGENAILDGEMVVFDEDGKPSFAKALLRDRVNTKEKIKYQITQNPLKYIVFDILYLNGQDLRGYKYEERREILIHAIDKSFNITITDDFKDGKLLYKMMEKQNLEGIVSKKINSIYKDGKSHEDWFKVKLNKKILVVVGGISLKNNYPNALLVGIFRGYRFEYIGKVATGLKVSELQLLYVNMQNLKINTCPFNNIDHKSNAIWIKPDITCWVSFMEWTNASGLRHPVLLGFSNLKKEEATGNEIIT